MNAAALQAAVSKEQPHVGQPLPTKRGDLLLLVGFAAVILSMPIWLEPFGVAYPDFMQKVGYFGVFAIGFNLLFGLTGYLSFGHAAFLGVGSYAAMWSFKLLGLNVLPAMLFSVLISGLFALVIGFVALRRSGIYFSILTLAFAQMCYNLAWSVLTPVTGGEGGLQLDRNDPRIFGGELADGATLTPDLFGIELTGMNGVYFCAVLLIAVFYFSLRVFRSPFGLMLRAIKTNQQRMRYTGLNPRPYALAVFVISGMLAGLAGAMWAAVDPQVGADRMLWTASGEVVLMTILGGSGTVVGPVIGSSLIKYIEAFLPKLNIEVLKDSIGETLAPIVDLFVGDSWHVTLGVMFMLVVIFLPGGVVEGARRISAWVRKVVGSAPRKNAERDADDASQPAE